MSAITQFLIHRRSFPLLSEPAPSSESLETMFTAAIAAPDHGQLQPYRFIVFTGERLRYLGELYAQSLLDAGEQDEVVIERARGLPLRAPMVIAAIAQVQTDNPKVPVQEQLITAGLATLQVINAAESLGYGAYWRTGSIAYHPNVAKKLGLATNESVVGFVYVGTPKGQPKAVVKNKSVKDIYTHG